MKHRPARRITSLVQPPTTRSLAVATAMVAMTAISAVHAASITVDTANVKSNVSDNPLGINLDYLMDDDSRVSRDRSTADALAAMNVNYLRYPGGEKSENYLWSISPFTTPDIKAARPNAWPASDSRFFTGGVDAVDEVLDFDEFMTMSQQAGTEAVIVVAFDSMYKAASGNETPPSKQLLKNTAVEWVRYANVTKGHAIKYWTLGNETDYPESYTGDNPGATTYANDVVEFAQAMRAIDPSIKIGINGRTRGWFRDVLAIAKDHVDYLEVHTYPFYGATSYGAYQSSNKDFVAEIEDEAIAAIDELDQSYQDKLFVALTETNAITFSSEWNDNDLGHALAVFDIFGRHLEVDKLGFAMLWNTRWVNNDSLALAGETPYTGPTLLGSANNPGFENGSAPWNLPGGASIDNDSHSGSAALKTDAASGDVFVTQDVDPSLFTSGLGYEFSSYSKKPSGSVWAGSGIDFYDNGTKVAGAAVDAAGSSYSKRTGTVIAPASFDQVQIWTYTIAGATAFFDDIAVAETVAAPSANDALDRKGNLYPIGRSLAIWGQFLKEEMVSVSGESTSLRAYASKGMDGSVSVALINKAGSSQSVTLTLQNHSGFTTGERWQFAGTGPADFAPVWNNVGTVTLSGNQTTFSAPATSITVLNFTDPAYFNILPNPGFENGATAWDDWGNSSVVSNNERSGTNALRIGTGGGGRGQDITSLLQPNTSYKLIGFAKMDDPSDGGWIGLDLEENGMDVGGMAVQFNGTNYQERSITFTTPAIFDLARVWIWKDAGSGYMYVDDLNLARPESTGNGDGELPTPVAITASEELNGLVAANAMDGDFGTRWNSRGNEWIQFEYARSYNFTTIDIAIYRGDSRVAYFDILVSQDGSSWTPVSSNLSSSGTTVGFDTYQLPQATSGRYLRIEVDGNSQNNWNALTEVKISGNDAPSGGNDGFLEIGELNFSTSASSDWLAVSFARSYNDPVVVAQSLSYAGADPSTIRIRNVNTNGFEIQIDEWDYLNGNHGAGERVGYIVMEKGAHTLSDGTKLEAGALSAVDHNFTAASFTQSFASAPVALCQVVTTNESSAVAYRMRNLDDNGFEVRVQEEEAADGTHADETVHFIAVAEGTAIGNGFSLEAFVVNGIDENFSAVNFQTVHDTPIFLAGMQSYNGADPANIRWRNLSSTGVEVFLEEEQSQDSELTHSGEKVGYLVFGTN